MRELQVNDVRMKRMLTGCHRGGGGAHLLHERDIRRVGLRIEPFRGRRNAVQHSHLVDAVSSSRPAETITDPPRRPVQDRVDRLWSRAGSEILRNDDPAGFDVAEDVPPRGTICKRRVAHSGDETGAAWARGRRLGFMFLRAQKRHPNTVHVLQVIQIGQVGIGECAVFDAM